MREGRSATGLTAEAGVERVQSDTRARMLRATDPYLRERLHDLDDLANRLMRQLMGAGSRADASEQLAGERHPGRPHRWAGGAARLRPQAAARLWCWRKAARPRMSRSSRARSAFRPSARSTMPPAWSIPATPSSSTASTGDVHRAAPARHRKPPMSSACGCARAGRRNTALCATSPASPRTATRSR